MAKLMQQLLVTWQRILPGICQADLVHLPGAAHQQAIELQQQARVQPVKGWDDCFMCSMCSCQ
jgi:hypothetical protein